MLSTTQTGWATFARIASRSRSPSSARRRSSMLLNATTAPVPFAVSIGDAV